MTANSEITQEGVITGPPAPVRKNFMDRFIDSIEWVAAFFVGVVALNTFTAVFPADQPKYLLLVTLDEPQALPETHGFATSAWNTAPAAAAIITRIAPLLSVTPRFNLPPADRLILASAQNR